MSEHGERLPVGPKGAKGERGERGMPRGQRRAVIYLFLLSVAMSVGTYLAAVHYYDDEQAAGHRQGLVLERTLCGSFGKLAALHPPAANPRTNPSRAYLQGEHAVLMGLGTDLGCRR